jgi:zinc protease
VALLWLGPAARDGDAAALRVAAALLGDGDSSRLALALVERERLAQSAGFSADLHADAGLLSAWAIAAQPTTGSTAARIEARLRRLEDALLRELHRLAHGTLPIGELDKVRTRLLTDALVARQTPEGRALALGWAVVQHGDPAGADAELARLQTVRAEDVQRVLRRHLLAQHRVALHYVEGR